MRSSATIATDRVPAPSTRARADRSSWTPVAALPCPNPASQIGGPSGRTSGVMETDAAPAKKGAAGTRVSSPSPAAAAEAPGRARAAQPAADNPAGPSRATASRHRLTSRVRPNNISRAVEGSSVDPREHMPALPGRESATPSDAWPARRARWRARLGPPRPYWLTRFVILRLLGLVYF